MTIDLPRSVLAALWIGSLNRPDGAGSLARAVASVQGDDEPHRTDVGEPLAVLIGDALGAEVVAVLPAPGEPVALGGRAGAAAMEAGECLVIGAPPGGSSGRVAVPDVTVFGSHLEPGALVTWHVFDGPAAVVAVDSPGDARRLLAEALGIAVDALTRMDVARWREVAAEEIALLASQSVPSSLEVLLPPELDPRRAELLVRAARLEAIVELAVADDGAAVNTWQVDQRAAALRHVASAARRAMSAASASGPPRR
ncbi:MAG: hypothetical protein JJE50_01950 [Actinomycetales bacterium]|nr:hypothetical protein [Actinomycetales bacterium]